ncbi:DHA1 family bicyclomycin/chloramphenicol resistance-like MFS transporter [Sphingomonas jejuensis]|uniref:Bcr/CflA family efflux transporter n=1 Tax=Sphingomonas jejuensis TaxID=904715 RepID=A0ABX0XPR2_9SPHN|nr:multidrug effflux MFS transporter [Sphingomonas jejuensis]NJC34655.1 DHA1 family bicyclomycin/chloramphenicol resistance-like MFS transporter [Sphingomonas jejuensis]
MGHDRIGFTEFVALIAALMAMTALSIDSMLPALPAIGESLQVVADNDRQWVIASFLIGFGLGQIVHGPLSDRFGRKPVLLTSLGFTILFNIAAAVAGSFTLLVAARLLSGVAVASSRVLTVSIVRDRYSGRQMARVMSLAFIVFMAAPILAPIFGQLVLTVAPWRAIFAALATAAAMLLMWAAWRLPETLPAENRRPLSIAALIQGFRGTLSDRMSVGYTAAFALLLAALYGFINSIQQVVTDVYGRADLLIPVFAAVGTAMAVASWFNARLVLRLGTRFISHWALIGFITFAAVHLLLALTGRETVVLFVAVQAAMMACFGLTGSNFGAMAMENMGRMAGMASSVQGFIGSTAGAVMGLLIGQAFDGTAVPLYLGFLVAGLGSLLLTFITERGTLFRRGVPEAAE